MAHVLAEAAFAAVRAELDNERAATLGRVAGELERARARCAALAATLTDGGPDAATRHREALARAEHLRWMLCVQREAIGLYDHRWVDAVYPPLPSR